MTPFNPSDAGRTEAFGKGSLEIERLPLAQRIEMFVELREKADTKAPDVPARLVSGLMLIEPPVRITGSLADVQSP